MFGPSRFRATMASADFSPLVVTIGFVVSPPTGETSPGKNDNFPLTYLPHLHHGIRAVLDFALNCNLVRPANALYAISVRQTEGLPPASFRFRLATDTLAFD